MTTTTAHEPGTFCWIELGTTDGPAARTFYTQLFDWTAKETPIGDGMVYTIFQNAGRDTAAMYVLQQEGVQQGVPPNWLSYIAVANVDASIAQATEVGGSVVAGPMDVMDAGRMAVLRDPQGASFAIWQANRQPGVGVRDEANSLCWNELMAHDLEAAKKFYVGLFGWRAKESPEYTEWHRGENAVGGMLQTHSPHHPSFWMPYFACANTDTTVTRATSLGGTIFKEPTDIPHVGRFAVVGDPSGAAFAVITLAM
jgi:predicted enzyme related to lactoylglutathione lyase